VTAPLRPTVVIADDEVHIVDVLAMLFEFYEVDVVKAYNGEQALQAVRDYAPRLLIADIMMPKLSGAEVCQRVKADPTLAQTIVILMSALPLHARPTAPADGYLPKPFELRRVEEYATEYFAERH
jgi:CheY-like chemotaxis protein